MSATVRRGVAIYEILIGLIAFVSAAVSRVEVSWLQVMLATIGGAVSVIAGVLLWRDKSIGRRLSLVVQALQVPHVSISGILEYGIGLGAAVTPNIGFIPQSFQHPIHSSLRFGSHVGGFYVGINVLALVALFLLARMKHENSPKSTHVVATA